VNKKKARKGFLFYPAVPLRYQKRKVNVYSLNAKLHSFRVLPLRTFAGKMLQIGVVQFGKRPRRANPEKQKNATKSAKKDFCYIF